METEFKEKTYEKYFSGEIMRLINISFSPDQCDESFLGFDDAFLLPLNRLLLIAPYIRRRRRRHLSGTSLRKLDGLVEDAIKRMPPFRFNLFIQYKRPVYLRTRGAREWSHWGSAYYRFHITPHQQRLLERLDAISRGRSATIYASPAFWSASDLWRFTQADQIIPMSNVASAGRLRGHDCYTYNEPGHRGIGHSEPENIVSVSLSESIEAGLAANDPVDAESHVIQTAAIVREAADSDEQTAQLLARVQGLYVADAPIRSSLVQALTTLVAFSDAFAISSYMLG